MVRVTEKRNCYFYLIWIPLHINSSATPVCWLPFCPGQQESVWFLTVAILFWVLDLHPRSDSFYNSFPLHEAYHATEPSLLVKWVILKPLVVNILAWKKTLGEGMREGSRNRIWEPCVLLRVMEAGRGWWWGRTEWRDGGIKDELPPIFQSCDINNNQDTNCINIILFPDHSSPFFLLKQLSVGVKGLASDSAVCSVVSH